MSEEDALRGILQQVNERLGLLEKFLADPGNVQAAQAAFADRSLAASEFFQFVPAGIMQTILALRLPQSFEQLRSHSEEEARPRLEQLRSQALSLFEGVEIHPAVMRRVSEIAKRATPSQHKGNTADFEFNAINSVTWFPMWGQTDNGISPLVRVGFAEHPERQLLDTTLTTDELSYVASVMTTILAEELERIGASEYKTMIAPGLIEDLDEARIIGMRSNFERIERAWTSLRGQSETT